MSKMVTILGIGESGIGAAMLASVRGYDVFLSDKSQKVNPVHLQDMEEQGFAFELGTHSEDRILESDMIVKSPGIPSKIPLIKKAKERGIQVLGEIEFAYQHRNPGCKIIAITGSNGKTTTSSLCYEIFKNDSQDVALVGNIGYSFAKQIALKPKSIYIIEVSSFQLDDIVSFRPDIAVLLNITPDHLDWYENDVYKYAQSKLRIISNQTKDDIFIHNLDDNISQEVLTPLTINPQQITISMKKAFKDQNKGESFVDNDGNLIITIDGKSKTEIPTDKLGLRGQHNIYNSMAASIPARIMDIRNEKIRQSLMDYKGLPHRLEYVSTVKGVDYINDSKATNLNSVWYALECMNRPTVLILGGVDKGNDYNIILDLVKEKVKSIVALGLNNEKITSFFSEHKIAVKEAGSMGTAIQLARDISLPGDVVLLSPACASFDLFDNYEDRGDQFKSIVKSL